MTDQGNLVPEPQSTIFDTVSQALGNDNAARKVMANPQLLGALGTHADDTPDNKQSDSAAASDDDRCACGKHSKAECEHDEADSEDDIPWAHPVEGLIVHIDLVTNEVIGIEDE